MKNAPGHASRDVNVRTFHIVRLTFLKEQLGEKVDVEEDIRKKPMNIGDCSTLTFYEFGNFRVQRGAYRQLGWFLCVCEIRYVIFQLLKKQMSHFFIWQMWFFFFDWDTDSHCPLMVWLEPADLFNQAKKSFQSDAGRKERADKRKADQKARKAKKKAQARSNFHQNR